jgi:cell division protein FtsW (lipid II flippase)
MISGNDGWGIGYVPWLGLPGARAADGLPLQAPSDYAFTIAQAIWGWTGAWSLMSVAALIFLTSAWRGCRIALGDGSSFMHRFIAAIGALGCIAVLAKALLSVAGTTRLLPLTGVPIALLSYAPAAMWAGLGYIALVLTIPRDEAVSP